MVLSRKAVGVLLLLVLLILAFGWPTLYRYEHMQSGILVRINRITGTTSYFDFSGWKNPEEERRKRESLELLEELRQRVKEAKQPTPGEELNPRFRELMRLRELTKTPQPTPSIP